MSHLFKGFKDFDYKAVRHNFKCDSCIFNIPAIVICCYDHMKYSYEASWIGADGNRYTQTFPGRKLVDLKKCPKTA